MTRFLRPGPRREEPFVPPSTTTSTTSTTRDERAYERALAATRASNPNATEPTPFHLAVAHSGGLRTALPAEPGLIVGSTLLKASFADRLLSYQLLPWGEVGRTSVGPIVVAGPGIVELPDEPGEVVLNLEHDGTRPCGRCVQLEEGESGLLAVFTILENRAGNDLLVEVKEGVRTGVSVELENIRRDGQRLLAGRLTGAGAVVRPAFDSARIRQDA